MHSPYVKSMIFAAGSNSGDVVYRDPPVVKWETSRARYQLESGRLTVELRERFSTECQAKAAIQPDLDAWEAVADLSGGIGELRFKLASLVMESGSEGAVMCSDVIGASDSCSVVKTKHRYPSPPENFNADSEIVRSLMGRFRDWKSGWQTLEGVAYYCAKLLRQGIATKTEAAERWRISVKVMDRLGTLSSRKGGPATARKPDAEPFGPGEREWLEKAVPAIILQVAAVEAGTEPNQLTNEDLPKLG